MKSNDFTTTIVVDQSPQRVFDAITHPEHWWSGEVKGSNGVERRVYLSVQKPPYIETKSS